MEKHEKMLDLRRRWKDPGEWDDGLSMFIEWAVLTQEYRVPDAYARFVEFIEGPHDGP